MTIALETLRLLSHRCVYKWPSTRTFLNFYFSHGSATRFLRNGEKYYVCFIDNLLLFPLVEEYAGFKVI